MLAAALSGSLSAGFAQVIDALGVPAEFHQTAAPAAVTNIAAVGFKTPGANDEAIINTIGVGGRVITVKAASLTPAPMKLDRVKVHGEMYTVEAVHVVDLNGKVLGWRLLCKGR
ncbi:MAG: head-tail joining protein [Limnohabitans sp.]